MTEQPRDSRAPAISRALSTAIVILALAVSLAAAIVIAGTGPPASPFNSASSNGSAAKKQYCDGKDNKRGCKPKPCHKKHNCKPKPKPCHKKHNCKPKPGHHH